MRTKLVAPVFICMMIFNAVAGVCAEPQNSVKKKLIELGWDIPTTAYLRQHWQEMEATAPFDGVVYDLVATSSEGKKCSSQSLFSPEPWNRDDFKTCVDDLNSCQFTRYKNNFVRVNFHPAGFAWTDDDAWRTVCEKVAICAWVANQTNGDLCFDFESYGAALFRYDPGKNLSFDETRALARKRGAELARAAFNEKADLVVLCLWMNSINYRSARLSKPNASLRGAGYGLLPAFIDGMLDAAPTTAKFIEGCENGYYMNGIEEYQRSSLDAKLDSGPGVALVSPENRGKYRQLVSSGFGFYLDMYSNPEGSTYYRGPEPGETRFDRLRVNLKAAWDSADEYVWVYGEQKRWWAPENGTEWQSWEEALPGLSEFLLELSDPYSAVVKLREKITNSPDSKNLIVNGDFSRVNAAANTAESWGTWRHEESRGSFQVREGAVAIKGDSSACYIQSFPAEPGKKYLISGRIAADGDSLGALVARWQDGAGRWVAESFDTTIEPEESTPADADGFRETIGAVVVPDAARALVLLLSANSSEPDEIVTFKDVEAYRAD